MNIYSPYIYYPLVIICLIYFLAASVLSLDYLVSTIKKLPTSIRLKYQSIVAKRRNRKENTPFKVRPLPSEVLQKIGTVLFATHPVRKLFFSSLFLVYLLGTKQLLSFNETFMNLIASIVFVVIIYFVTKFPKEVIIGKMIGIYLFDVLYVLLGYVSYFAAYYGALLSIAQVQLNYLTVIIALIANLWPLIKFANICIEAKAKDFNIVLLILILLAFELSLFLIFGAYNASNITAYREILNMPNLLYKTLRVLQVGSMYIFEYPAPEVEFQYASQYLIGFFVHAIMFGFYISIISSKILEVNKYRRKYKLGKAKLENLASKE